MMAIKFIADVHISPATVSHLKSSGHDIQRVTDYLPANSTDEQIINLSIEKDAVIVTQDLDFSDLIILHGLKKPSIISIRLEKPIPEKITKILNELFPKIKNELLEGCIVSVTEKQFRIKKLL
ncbi:MAG: DUF5615 family PIN-like protein [Ignavibacteriaceae bacterium]